MLFLRVCQEFAAGSGNSSFSNRGFEREFAVPRQEWYANRKRFEKTACLFRALPRGENRIMSVGSAYTVDLNFRVCGQGGSAERNVKKYVCGRKWIAACEGKIMAGIAGTIHTEGDHAFCERSGRGSIGARFGIW